MITTQHRSCVNRDDDGLISQTAQTSVVLNCHTETQNSKLCVSRDECVVVFASEQRVRSTQKSFSHSAKYNDVQNSRLRGSPVPKLVSSAICHGEIQFPRRTTSTVRSRTLKHSRGNRRGGRMRSAVISAVDSPNRFNQPGRTRMGRNSKSYQCRYRIYRYA